MLFLHLPHSRDDFLKIRIARFCLLTQLHISPQRNICHTERASKDTLVFSSHCPKYGFGERSKGNLLQLDSENHKHTTEASSCKQTMTIPVKKANFLRKLDIVVANIRLTMKNIFKMEL